MTNLLVNSNFKWDYSSSYIWGFYKNIDIVYAQKNAVSFWHNEGYFPVYFRGDNLSVKDKFVGGYINTFYVNSNSQNIYMDDFRISAKIFGSFIEVNKTSSIISLMKLIFSDDDYVMLGTGDDIVKTYEGDDIVFGRIGSDMLDGGAGDDVLYGGVGNDTLTGSSGEDIFVFDTKPSASKNIDTITDFSVRSDVIALDHLIFRKVGHAGELASSAFLSNGTGKAADASDRIIYNNKTGILYYDTDGSGSGVAVAFAKLDAGLKLTADSFDIL